MNNAGIVCSAARLVPELPACRSGIRVIDVDLWLPRLTGVEIHWHRTTLRAPHRWRRVNRRLQR